jgi:hypothetical protein
LTALPLRNDNGSRVLQSSSAKRPAAFFPDFEQAGHPDSVVCGWFPGGNWNAVVAGAKIQQALLRCELPTRRPVLFAVGRHEHAAFRLVRAAGENQVVIDPMIWNGFDEREAALAEAMSIHPPDHSSRDQTTDEIVAAVFGAIRAGVGKHDAKVAV